MNLYLALAERVIGLESVQSLKKHGMTIVPTALVEQLRGLKGEEVLILEGRAIIISPASPNEVERVAKGMILD